MAIEHDRKYGYPALVSRSVSDIETATIDIDRDTEFAGDDVDRYSSLVDLGGECSTLAIWLPAIDSAAISIYAQRDGEVDTVPVPIHYRQSSDNATAAWATTASTGGLCIVCPLMGAVRYLRLYSGANQTADRAIPVQGVA